MDVINFLKIISLFLYPQKTSEDRGFSWVFRGYRRDQWNKMLMIQVTWICSFTLTDDVIILVRSSYGEILDYFRFKMDIHFIWNYFLLIKEFWTDIFLPYWPYLFFLVCSIFELGHWMFKFGLLSGTDFTKITFF